MTIAQKLLPLGSFYPVSPGRYRAPQAHGEVHSRRHARVPDPGPSPEPDPTVKRCIAQCCSAVVICLMPKCAHARPHPTLYESTGSE
jgi:hypothetical protein